MSTLAANGGRRRNWRRISLILATAFVVLLGAANAHLVYVAVTSQPDCVPHEKAKDGNGHPGSFRAAKSAC